MLNEIYYCITKRLNDLYSCKPGTLEKEALKEKGFRGISPETMKAYAKRIISSDKN
jgi:hypothetical protein